MSDAGLDLIGGEMKLIQIGVVHSPFTELSKTPKYGSETDAVSEIHIQPEYADCLLGVEVGMKLVVVCWLHLSDRDVMQVHPRGDVSRPIRGVFATRSPARPNPISINVADVIEIEETRLKVQGMDALDGTPVVDLKKAVLDGEA